jgi:hypothetical protein
MKSKSNCAAKTNSGDECGPERECEQGIGCRGGHGLLPVPAGEAGLGRSLATSYAVLSSKLLDRYPRTSFSTARAKQYGITA